MSSGTSAGNRQGTRSGRGAVQITSNRAIVAEARRLMDALPGPGGRIGASRMRTIFQQAARAVARRR